MAEIYVLIDGRSQGPYTEEQVRQSLAEGLFSGDLPAWHEGLAEWKALREVVAFVAPPPLENKAATPPPEVPAPPTAPVPPGARDAAAAPGEVVPTPEAEKLLEGTKPLFDPLMVVGKVGIVFLFINLGIGVLLFLLGDPGGLGRAIGGCLVSLFLIFLIKPSRVTNAFYLRAFRTDPQTAKIRRRLISILGPANRLSGIRPPRERVSTFIRFFAPGFLAFWYAGSKFMELEAGDDWMARLWKSYQRARLVFIDVRDITQYVHQEIILTTRTMGLARCVFLIDDRHPPEEWHRVLSSVLGDEYDATKVQLLNVASARLNTRDFQSDLQSILAALPPGEAGRRAEGQDFVLRHVSEEILKQSQVNPPAAVFGAMGGILTMVIVLVGTALVPNLTILVAPLAFVVIGLVIKAYFATMFRQLSFLRCGHAMTAGTLFKLIFLFGLPLLPLLAICAAVVMTIQGHSKQMMVQKEAIEREKIAVAKVEALVATETPQDGQPWRNSLGMTFVPAGTPGVLFSVWHTRVEDYQVFVAAKGRDWLKADFTQGPTHPAVNISWDDAEAFCQWLTEKERKEGKLGPGQSYRLPTDAEWSKAVGLDEQAGGTPESLSKQIRGVYPWGGTLPPPPDAGNYDEQEDGGETSNHTLIPGTDGYPYTSPVGSYRANQYGLYDMGGDAWQWCEDWYNDRHYGHALRGCSWDTDDPDALLSSYRDPGQPGVQTYGNCGFRCVVVVAPPAVSATTGTAAPPPAPTVVEPAPPSTPPQAGPWVNSLGVKFVPAGTDGVLFSIWDVRVKDYAAFVAANPSYDAGTDWKTGLSNQTDDDPVTNVSWIDAHAFCDWLTKKEQAEGRLNPNERYRLPTDAEWSKAVELENEGPGTPKDKDRKITGIYPWGVSYPPPKDAGNYDESVSQDSYLYTSPVGSFAANIYGLYDMGGNVWQWCEDKYDPSQEGRVLRGGSWLVNNRDLRDLLSSCRNTMAPGTRYFTVGFRVVLVVAP